MVNVLFFILLGILGITVNSYSQEIPLGMKKIMELLQTDSTTEYGYNFAKELKFIEHNVKFSDWYVGLPIEFYKLNGEALENEVLDNNNIMGLLLKTNTWRIPVKVDGHYIYYVMVLYENGAFKSIGCGEDVLGFDIWDNVMKKYPEKTGEYPIVIDMMDAKFIYFSDKKSGKNLFCVRDPKRQDELSKITSKNLDVLDDNIKIIQYWKKDWEKNKESRRKFFEKNPDLFKEQTGGKK